MDKLKCAVNALEAAVLNLAHHGPQMGSDELDVMPSNAATMAWVLSPTRVQAQEFAEAGKTTNESATLTDNAKTARSTLVNSVISNTCWTEKSRSTGDCRGGGSCSLQQC